MIDARKNHWVIRTVADGPKLTSQIREEVSFSLQQRVCVCKCGFGELIIVLLLQASQPAVKLTQLRDRGSAHWSHNIGDSKVSALGWSAGDGSSGARPLGHAKADDCEWFCFCLYRKETQRTEIAGSYIQ